MRQALATIAALLLAPLILAGPAAAERYVVDKSHAFITFTADHLGFSAVHGQFRDFDAEIDFDPSDVESSRITFTVRTESVETYHKARDDQLRSAAFFDSAKFPEMVFTSTEVRPTGSDTALIKGDLTLIGVTREIELDAKLNQIGPSPFFPDIMVAGFTITGVIDRTQFGMTFGAPAIGVEIPIRIDLEMSPVQ